MPRKTISGYWIKQSLIALLTSGSNKSFIKNSTQASRGKAYHKKGFGSCYMFQYEEIEDSNAISIDGVEMNL